MSKKIVVVLSGGMDSAVLLHHHLRGKEEVRAITINYGQRHDIEVTHAQDLAQSLGVPWHCANLNQLCHTLPGSSQTDSICLVPEGHYAEESMKLTVVPNRNMILLAVAIGHAIAHQFDFVSYGAHAGDHAIYPDCRPEFAEALNNVAGLCDWRPISLLRPFVHLTKAGIAKLGAEMNVDFRKTYSCYKGGRVHCGRCGTCVERLLAFEEAGVPDTTEYLDREFAHQIKQKPFPTTIENTI